MVNCIEKMKTKKKEAGNDPFFKTQILNLYISCQNCRVPFDALKEQIEQEMFTKIVHKRVLFQTK